MSAGSVYLLFNHYKYFKDVALNYTYSTEEFCLKSNVSAITFNKADIVNIIEYQGTGSRIPWSEIKIWKILLKDRTIMLAPIIISGSNFRKIFDGINYEREFEFFVRLKK